MNQESSAFRLAIGVFYEPERLQRAIADLGADGVSEGQLCLVGTREAVDALRPRPARALPNGMGQLVGRLQALAPVGEHLALFATDCHLLHGLLEHTAANRAGTGAAHSWHLPDLFAGLAGHLRAGAVVLLVGAPDIGAQRRISRILLRHSAHTVQTHEFALRRGGA
jgi:hypothetical protein